MRDYGHVVSKVRREVQINQNGSELRERGSCFMRRGRTSRPVYRDEMDVGDAEAGEESGVDEVVEFAW